MSTHAHLQIDPMSDGTPVLGILDQEIVHAARVSSRASYNKEKDGAVNNEEEVLAINESETLAEGPTTGKYEEWAYVSVVRWHYRCPLAHLAVPVLQRRLRCRAKLVFGHFIPKLPKSSRSRLDHGRTVHGCSRRLQSQLWRCEARLFSRLGGQRYQLCRHDAAFYYDWQLCRLWDLEQVDSDRGYR